MGGRLLIVEDEDVVRRGLVRRLTAEGWDVVGAPDGSAALAELERLRFDLVVLDLQLPGLDGVSVLERIRAKWAPLELPVLMLTGVTESELVVQALDAGANDYVTKPVEPSVLVARIRSQLRQSSSAHHPNLNASLLLEPGTMLDDKYRLVERIGQGGYGVVFKAKQVHLDRDVAVKILLARHADRPEVRRRFATEGITACRVQHPNAVTVLDAGTTSAGLPYLAMELLEGPSLADEIQRTGPMRLARAKTIIVPVCDVLGAAHKSGVIHRDIKPSNVILARIRGVGETVKVLDFGIAKLVDASAPRETGENAIPGTTEYLSPERLLGEPAGPASDVYSVGVTLYEMLTKTLPYGDSAPHAIAQALRQLQAGAVDVSTHRPDLPRGVAAAVMAALERDPASRITLDDLRDEISATPAVGEELGATR
ncbi:MAG TPA: response regulator [Polyangiaceae bacterium]|jgi:serine/threonine protein kinase|nr:response regulator [Polyangiaceae bacterium]